MSDPKGEAKISLGKESTSQRLIVEAMEKQRTIIETWLQGMSRTKRAELIAELGQKMHDRANVPLEAVLEQLAAGLMATCADDLGLAPMELTGLLRTPRKDALAGLVTVLRNDE